MSQGPGASSQALRSAHTAPELATEPEVLFDLARFGRIEWSSGDLEPWAEVIRELHRGGELDTEAAAWVLKLYNAYDDLGSAWAVFRRWPSVDAWAWASDSDECAMYPCTQERRNLRGGKVYRHLASYAAHLDGGSQLEFLQAALFGDDPGRDFLRLMDRMRGVWGVGRQTAFEWAEFAGKVLGLPVDAPDAQLWESEGPRRSLQRLFGNPRPDVGWLNLHAGLTRDWMAEQGAPLAWVDFETVICDFNVMRDGRYYPGRHLAALREEIDGMSKSDRAVVGAAWDRVIPEPWRGIAPGIVKAHLSLYRDTGQIRSWP